MESHKRVLVVEDEAEVLFVWVAALKKVSGIEVETAQDGYTAVERFRAAPHDLVITDLAMPGMGGVELTKAIHRLDRQVPIVWVTAHTHFREGMEEDGLNVHTFLAKPVSIQEMRQVVRDALDL